MAYIKIKDLPNDATLDGRKLKVPLSVRKRMPELSPIMIITSGWNKGLWCKKKESDSRIYPVFFENFDEVKEWQVEETLFDEIRKHKARKGAAS